MKSLTKNLISNLARMGKQEGHTPSFSNLDKEESFVKTI